MHAIWTSEYSWLQGSWGQHGAHLGPVGPRCAPCWPHELCYLRLHLVPLNCVFMATECFLFIDAQSRIFKSPRVTGGLIVFAVSAAAVLPTLFNFPGKPLKLISSNHTWLTYGCGKMFWHPSRWPWVKVTKLPKRDTIYLVPTIKWEQLVQSLQNILGISPYYAIFLIKFWRNSANFFFLQFFA